MCFEDLQQSVLCKNTGANIKFFLLAAESENGLTSAEKASADVRMGGGRLSLGIRKKRIEREDFGVFG